MPQIFRAAALGAGNLRRQTPDKIPACAGMTARAVWAGRVFR
ncbi:hypothetical protein [Kingella potus]|nr:hypothetical protein [Kingella potus]